MRRQWSLALAIIMGIGIFTALPSLGLRDINFWELIFVQAVPLYALREPSVPLMQKVMSESVAQEDKTLSTSVEEEADTEVMSPERIMSIFGEDDIIFQDHDKDQIEAESTEKPQVTAASIDMLRDFDYLKKNLYTVRKDTDVTLEQLNVDEFINRDLRLDNSVEGYKILIFHTHGYEEFVDSSPSNPSDGIIGAGERLKNILEEKYGVSVLHNTDRFDIVGGNIQIEGAYERMEPVISKIIKDNPSIQLVIDLHRDGVLDETTKFVTKVNGRETAQLMFFNGLCQTASGGVIKPIASLPNPYLDTNLALSFNLQLAANELYPGLARKIYLSPYRYSLHMLPKSMLVEVGAQTSTEDEISSAMDILARLIAEVVL